MIEMIATLLTDYAPMCTNELRTGNPTLMLAADIAFFTDRAQYERLLSAACEQIKAVPPADGFKGVILPGEPELEAERNRKREGPVPLSTLNSLRELAER